MSYILIIAFTLCDLLLPSLELLSFLPDSETCWQAEKINALYCSHLTTQIELRQWDVSLRSEKCRAEQVGYLWTQLRMSHKSFAELDGGFHRRKHLGHVARKLNWERATRIEDLRMPLPVPVEK